MSDHDSVWYDVDRDALADSRDEREALRADAFADAMSDLEPDERQQARQARAARRRQQAAARRAYRGDS